MHELFRGHSAIENPRVAFLEDDHAASLDPRISGINRDRHDIGKPHVGDEPAAFVHLQQRFLSVHPFGHPDLAAEHAGLDPNKWERLRQGECGADLPALLTRLRRHRQRHIMSPLFRRPALVDRRQT